MYVIDELNIDHCKILNCYNTINGVELHKYYIVYYNNILNQL